MRMKRSGRASIVIVITAALVLAVVALFFLAGESPSGVATKFLVALAKGDTKTLADLSYMEGQSKDQVEKKWEETYSHSKYWIFSYQLRDTKEQSADSATVVLSWVKNSINPGAYEEKYELPMMKIDGKWKVDVRGISREMYPALPR